MAFFCERARRGDVVTNLLDNLREDRRGFLAEHRKIAPIKRAGAAEEMLVDYGPSLFVD